MISYNSQTTEGSYKIQIETDNRKFFEIIEEITRLMIDKSLYERKCMEELVTCELCFFVDGDLLMCDKCGRYFCEECGSYGECICSGCKSGK